MPLFAGQSSAPTRFGEDVANTGDFTGLFLKIFGGEVFTAFTENVITMDKHFVREIASGKSAQFPKTWKVESEYHEAGKEMLGQTTDETERVITIDGLLVSHIGIYDLDEAMSHFDVRSEYTTELGRSLARTFDQNFMRANILTARDSTTLGGGSQTTSPFPAGQVVSSANVTATIATSTLAATGAGQDWFNALRYLRVVSDLDNIPSQEPWWVAVPPDTFDALLFATQNDSATANFLFANRDNTFAQGDNIGAATDEILRLRDINVIKSNLIPQADDSAASGVKAKYRADYTRVLGCGWGRTGIGTVKLVGMGLEQTRDTRRQEDFFVAKMAVGHGPLRNEFTAEFFDA